MLDGVTPRSSAAIGLDVVRAVEAVDRSLAAGGAPVPVDVPDAQLAEELAARVASIKRFTPRRDRRTPGRDRTSVGTAVLGAGPAGLTAAYVLGQRSERGVVLEAAEQVGGISKTVVVDGYGSTWAATASSPSSRQFSRCGRRHSGRRC